jgi:hypothetical protein
MTIKEAKTIDMVGYLSMHGIEPAKVKGNNYWYHSPFRTERTPSFKVNRQRNEWYDFAEGKGGNVLNFVLQWKSCTISEALEQLSHFSIHQMPLITGAEAPPAIEIVSVYYVGSFHLVRYYRSRRIADEVASQYVREVRYKNGGKMYYALGFKNSAGGYELRSEYFKGSSHPKAPSFIKNDAESLAVFEGFFDFLSYCTICLEQPAPARDFLILNSTSFFEKQLPFMQAYKRVHLYLDNDATGDKYTALALDVPPGQFVDERHLYHGYKDLSEWHQHIGTAPKPAA